LIRVVVLIRFRVLLFVDRAGLYPSSGPIAYRSMVYGLWSMVYALRVYSSGVYSGSEINE